MRYQHVPIPTNFTYTKKVNKWTPKTINIYVVNVIDLKNLVHMFKSKNDNDKNKNKNLSKGEYKNKIKYFVDQTPEYANFTYKTINQEEKLNATNKFMVTKCGNFDKATATIDMCINMINLTNSCEIYLSEDQYDIYENLFLIDPKYKQDKKRIHETNGGSYSFIDASEEVYVINLYDIKNVISSKMYYSFYSCTPKANKNYNDLEYLLESVPVCENFKTEKKYIFDTFCTGRYISHTNKEFSDSDKIFIGDLINSKNISADCKIGLSIEQYKLYEKIFGLFHIE